MNYDTLFNVLNDLDKNDIIADKCCDLENNYNFTDNIITCKICNNMISNILDSPEWRYYGSEDTKNSDPTRCGMAINLLLPKSSIGSVVSNKYCKDKSMYQVKKYQQWTSMPYKERSNYKIFNDIKNICDKNNLPKIILNEANSLYKLISDTKISRGNNRIGIIAACIYFSCKNCNVGRSSKEIAVMFNIKISVLTKGCKNLQSILQLGNNKDRIDNAVSILPNDFIERFCNRLNIEINDINNIIIISNNISKMNLINDIRPDSFATGCILLYCIHNNINIDKKQISECSKISEVTINKCYKNLKIHENDIFKNIS